MKVSTDVACLLTSRGTVANLLLQRVKCTNIETRKDIGLINRLI